MIITIFEDFNAVLSFSKRWGVHVFGLISDEFVSLVELLGFQDLPFIGC